MFYYANYSRSYHLRTRWSERAARLARAALSAIAGVWLCAGAPAQEVLYTEAEVKASYLYHFATYVQWPEESDTPISIAVLGAPTVATQLEDFLAREPDRRIRDREVIVRNFGSLRDLDSNYHVLFVGAELEMRLDDVVSTLGTRPVLLVTDARDALDRGAMINFQVVDENVRFEISLRNAGRAGLMLSSRLLNAATHVETSKLWVSEPIGPLLAERAQNCGRACRATLATEAHARLAVNAAQTPSAADAEALERRRARLAEDGGAERRGAL